MAVTTAPDTRAGVRFTRLVTRVLTTVLICLTVAGAAVPAAADTDQARRRGSAVDVPRGVTASFAVYDRESGRFVATRDPHVPFRSASVVKLLIALDDLIQNDPVLDLDAATTDEQRMDILALRTMLRGSWDYAASAFWVRGGFTDMITRMAALIELPDTAAPAERGVWGYTTTEPLVPGAHAARGQT